MTLQCAAEGVPRPAVTWLKDGRPITGQHGAKVLNEGRLLQIKDAKVSDTGRYTCIAVNVAGQADSKHDISVHGMNFFFIITNLHFGELQPIPGAYIIFLSLSLIPPLFSTT